MKILKISGAVLAIHAVFFLLIYVIPGCSAPDRPTPVSTLPSSGKSALTSATPPMSSTISLGSPASGASSPVPMNFDPNAPASAPDRYPPTRPMAATPAAAAAPSITLSKAPPIEIAPAKTYTAAGGDSLWSLAKKNNVTVAELAAANKISSTATLRVGQKLVIPARMADPNAPASAAPAVAATGGATKGTTASASAKVPEGGVIIVKPGETLLGIAQKYGVNMGDISTANNLTSSTIRAGMKLIIPGWQVPKASPKSTPAGTTTAAKGAAAPPPPANSIPVLRIEGASSP